MSELIKQKEILVLGDSIVDEYVFGNVYRVSPEAPIPILDVTSSDIRGGGAANAALTLSSLGATVTLVSTLSQDSDGDKLYEILAASGVEFAGSRLQGPSIVKTRFASNAHQLLRVDADRGCEPILDQDFASCLDTLEKFSCIVFSDYNKGALTVLQIGELISEARKLQIPIVVDSKRADLTCFRGATLVAPNLKEAQRASGLDSPEQAARFVGSTTGAAVALTMGSAGILLRGEGFSSHHPSVAQEVVDVTGAGDAVTAGLALALASAASMFDACVFANVLASIAVSRFGTHHVSLGEVPNYAQFSFLS